MNQTPMGFNESLCIGVVEYVSPNQITVLLNIDAPDAISLNTGTPQLFPRINSYVLVPCDAGFLVGQIEWLTVEMTPYPKRKGIKDFGLVDLPYPSRKMSLNPIGKLFRRKISDGVDNYLFSRGSESLPTVGDNVLLPTERQLKSIIESGYNRRVKIGISPLAGNVDVCIDPDRLFGRHLAVLGNTGSGKSCSVAGLIRWSIEAAAVYNKTPNARFIVLDPNGEYSKAFSKDETVLKPQVFKIESDGNEKPLKVPLWFWNTSEWCSFAQASTRTQRPTLVYALRAAREGLTEILKNDSSGLRRFIRTIITTIQIEQHSGNPWSSYPRDKSFFEKLNKWKESFEDHFDISESEQVAIDEMLRKLDELIQPRNIPYPTYTFSRQEVIKLLDVFNNAYREFGGCSTDMLPIDADIPIPFTEDAFLKCLDSSAEILNVTEYVDTMITRINTIVSDSRLQAIIECKATESLAKWLEDYMGGKKTDSHSLSIIDLSLVPNEIVHIITAVIARMIFEALQRYRKLNDAHKVLPTVLVMEEAHTFIRRYNEGNEFDDTASVCCKVFERIAREGRKFGLGLVLSSQRPSELSTTVLSQCNSFLIHRISNDRDQDIVHRFVPDNLKGLLRELPMLPSQNAILLGWASELPILVKMSDLPEWQRPQSEDPDFWNVWLGEERKVDWEKIEQDWQGRKPEANK